MTRVGKGLVALLLMSVVVLVPLPFGSNRPLPWVVLGVSLGTLMVLWSLLVALSHDRPESPRNFWIAAGAFGLVLTLLSLQTMPFIPPTWWHPFWHQAAWALEEPVPGRISVDPYATGTASMRLLTYAAVFWLTFQLCFRRRRAYRLVRVVAIAGFAYAVYGLLVEALDLRKVALVPKWAYLDSLTSTFINRNSYATYAGLGLICALTLLIVELYGDLRRLFGDGLASRRLVVDVVLRSAWLIPCTVCLALALFLTDSRAGIASTGVGVLVLLLCLTRARVVPRAQMREAAVAIAGIAVGAFVLAGQEAVERTATAAVDIGQRLSVYERTLDLIASSGLLGTGYGTFEPIFRVHQGWEHATYRWDHAHNTYLENALELGVPAAVALLVAVGFPAWWCLRALLRRERDPVFAAVGLAATALVGVHALVDFSIEMAAVAVTYAAIMGAACARVSSGPPLTKRRGLRERRFHMLVPALALTLGAGLLTLAVPRAASLALTLPHLLTQHVIRQGGLPLPDRLDAFVSATRSASEWARAPDHWIDLARAYNVHAAHAGASPGLAAGYLRESERALLKALSLAPANPWIWARLAALRAHRDGARESAARALSLSLTTGSYQPDLLRFRARLAFALWEHLDPLTVSRMRPQLIKAFRREPAAMTRLAVQSGRAAELRQAFTALGIRPSHFDAVLRQVAPSEWHASRPRPSLYSLQGPLVPEPVEESAESPMPDPFQPPPQPAWQQR